jgi:hypothetical protein
LIGTCKGINKLKESILRIGGRKILFPKFVFWEFKIHNRATAVLDFHQRLADKLLLKFKVVTSLDKYLSLIFTASDSTEIWKGSQSGREKIILN